MRLWPQSRFLAAVISHRLAAITCLVLMATTPGLAEPLRIGLAAPMSGPFSELGAQMENGIRTALATRTRRGTPEIELVITDDQCTRDGAKAAANQLMGARVDVVIGHVCWGASFEGARIYAAASVPQISPATRHPSFTDEDFGAPGLRFRLTGRDDRFGPDAARYITMHYPGARIAILHDNTALGKDIATRLNDALEAGGTRLARFETFQSGLSDYGSLAIQLDADAIDVLFLGAYHADAAMVIKALKARQSDIAIIGSDAILIDDFLIEANEAANGIEAIAPPDPRQLVRDPALFARFKDKDTETFGLTLPAYAAVELILSAYDKAPDNIAAALSEQGHSTIFGEIRFTPQGDSNLPDFVPYLWKDGSYRHKNRQQ